MDRTTIATFFALLRSGLRSEPMSAEARAEISTEQLPKLAQLAKKYDLEHLFALGLRHNGLASQQTQETEKSILVAAFRQQRLQDAQKTVCAALEGAGIPFLPLKGAVLRDAYPEPWMRTSCDIDVLVRKEDAQRAATLLEETCRFTRDKTDSHDISLYGPNKAHLELHYDLIERGLVREADRVLASVWERAEVKAGSRYHYTMPDDLFYCYHIAHMAKHFAIGGCGIRPFLDLWILESGDPAAQARRDATLTQAGLLRFANTVRALSRAWFENAPMDSLTEQMEAYILRGRMYGDNENRIAVQQRKQGGRLRYLLVRIFLPFDILKFRYPVLQKHPWLMPVMQVHRWCKLLFCGHMGRIRRDLAFGRQITKQEEAETKLFLENIGLLPK